MPDDKAGLNQRLFEAAREGNAAGIGELIEQGADLDARDSGGWAASA